MDEHTSHELAYKKGYEDGYRDGKDRVMGDIAFHKLLERPPERSREELEYLMQSPVVLIKDTESINQIYPYSRWIPVTERLPEDEELVLILCKNGAMFVGYCGKQYCDYERRWRIKTALNSTKLLNLGRVTHWMPLPSPPSMEVSE